MPHFKSLGLRARLTLTYTALLLLAFLVLGLVLHALFSRGLRAELDGEIKGDAQGAGAWIKDELRTSPEDEPAGPLGKVKNPDPEGGDSERPSEHPAKRPASDEGDGHPRRGAGKVASKPASLESMDFVVRDVFLQLADPRGGTLQLSDNLQGQPLLPGKVDLSGPARYFWLLHPKWGRLRCYSLPVATRQGTYEVVTAKSVAQLNRSLDTLFHVFLVVVPLALLAAGGGGYLVAGRALSPIAEITATARAISSGDLSRRIELDGPRDELGQLADTFDGMIASIEQLVTAQQRFFADASHELRTPLTVIMSALEIGLRTPSPHVRQLQESMRVALDESRHMKRLVDDLMMLARADAGQGGLALRPVALDDLLKEACEAARWMMGQRELALRLEEEVTVDADAAQLRRLMMNLLTNATQHTTETGNITVTLGRREGWATIEVADDGSGIPADQLASIFDRFHRVDGARGRDTGGTGLGLAICRWIAEAHGGSLTAQSTRQEGTTLTLLLPAK